jgi:hypothetical protein
MEIISLWPTTLIRNHKIFSNHDAITQLAKDSADIVSVLNIHKETEDVFNKLSKNPELTDLKKWILTTVHLVVSEKNKNYWDKDYAPHFSKFWSWSSNNYYNAYHTHFNASWSGIYCLESKQETTDNYNSYTLLYSPLPPITYSDPGTQFLEKEFMHCHLLEPGDLLLFPSYLGHSAKYNGIENRTIIAFNISFNTQTHNEV